MLVARRGKTVALEVHLLEIEDGVLSELTSPMDKSPRPSHVRHQTFPSGELWPPYASLEGNV